MVRQYRPKWRVRESSNLPTITDIGLFVDEYYSNLENSNISARKEKIFLGGKKKNSVIYKQYYDDCSNEMMDEIAGILKHMAEMSK